MILKVMKNFVTSLALSQSLLAQSLLVLCLLGFPTSALPQATPQTFRDWSVVCDNVKTCMAFSSSSQSEGGLAKRPLNLRGDVSEGWMTIMRVAGPNTSAQILLSRPDLSRSSLPAGAEIHLVGPNGRLVPRGVFAATLGSLDAIEIAAVLNADFLRVARTASHAILVAGPAKRPVFYVSLSGLVASGRNIDARQGRTGAIDALIDTGRVPASRAPTPPPLPVINAVAFTKRSTITATAEIMRKRQTDCDDAQRFDPGGRGIEAFDLGTGRTLWSVPCGAGAYNTWNRFYLGQARGGALVRANFFRPNPVEGQDDINLTNASIDPTKGIITSFSKARGIGDCGSEETYAWNGTDFVLADSHEMVPCGGIVSGFWPSTYAARVVTTTTRRR
jgi:hypothetical protein